MLKTSIPFVDLRGKTPVDLLRAWPDKAHALVAASRRTWGVWSQAASLAALPFADRRSLAWLKRTRNPYLYEIESFAEILGVRGVYTLNLGYEWGCTSGAYRTDGQVSLLRLLDWPFPELGRHVMAVLQQSKAGEYYNVTWPGVSGVTTAMAPGRFAGALNQAPMRMHGLGYAGDWAKNRLAMQRAQGLPPAHALRQVFEQAHDYNEAKRMLGELPLAMPAIFILTGTKAGQGCVIERLENKAVIVELGAGQRISAANHFTSPLAGEGRGWRPRAEDSAGRYRQSCAIHGYDLQTPHFNWLHAPMINRFTRLCVVAEAATSRLTVQGYEGTAQVTERFSLITETEHVYDIEQEVV